MKKENGISRIVFVFNTQMHFTVGYVLFLPQRHGGAEFHRNGLRVGKLQIFRMVEKLKKGARPLPDRLFDFRFQIDDCRLGACENFEIPGFTQT